MRWPGSAGARVVRLRVRRGPSESATGRSVSPSIVSSTLPSSSPSVEVEPQQVVRRCTAAAGPHPRRSPATRRGWSPGRSRSGRRAIARGRRAPCRTSWRRRRGRDGLTRRRPRRGTASASASRPATSSPSRHASATASQRGPKRMSAAGRASTSTSTAPADRVGTRRRGRRRRRRREQLRPRCAAARTPTPPSLSSCAHRRPSSSGGDSVTRTVTGTPSGTTSGSSSVTDPSVAVRRPPAPTAARYSSRWPVPGSTATPSVVRCSSTSQWWAVVSVPTRWMSPSRSTASSDSTGWATGSPGSMPSRARCTRGGDAALAPQAVVDRAHAKRRRDRRRARRARCWRRRRTAWPSGASTVDVDEISTSSSAPRRSSSSASTSAPRALAPSTTSWSSSVASSIGRSRSSPAAWTAPSSRPRRCFGLVERRPNRRRDRRGRRRRR